MSGPATGVEGQERVILGEQAFTFKDLKSGLFNAPQNKDIIQSFSCVCVRVKSSGLLNVQIKTVLQIWLSYFAI